MVRYNNLSILRFIDLSSTGEVQELIHALCYYFPTNASQVPPETPPPEVSGHCEAVIIRIVNAINRNPDYPLLRQIIDRFIDPKRYKIDKWTGGTLETKTEEAVREIEGLISELVFIGPSYRRNGYFEAEERFDKLIEREKRERTSLRYVYLKALGLGIGVSCGVGLFGYCISMLRC